MTDEMIVPEEETGVIAASPEDLKALLANTGPSKYATSTAMTEVTKVGDWLPYIQLMSGSSKEVKRGEFPMGHFCLRKNRQMIDMGDTFILYALSWRPKAMTFAPNVLSFYDTESDDFQRIQLDSKKKDSGCGFGPEFLVWLPEHNELATYFMGNKTGRNESPNVIALIENGVNQCKQASHLIDDGKNTWHGAQTLPYDLEIALPPMALLTEELQKFNNPPLATEEAPEAIEGDDDRR